MVLVCAIGCHTDSTLDNEENKNLRTKQPDSFFRTLENQRGGLPPGKAAYYSYTDWSGQIEALVMTVPQGQSGVNTVTATLPPEYVLVGGGARTTDTDITKGAFITASYPNWVANSWTASSKHHVHNDPHTLTVYAIGIKIQGVTAQTLRSVMTCTAPSTSGSGTQPYAQAFMPSSHHIIGGGARIDYGSDDGNLMVYSRPSNGYWEAKGKDHIHQSFATITVWAIGIQDFIPGFGYIDVINYDSSWVSGGPCGTGLITQVPSPTNYFGGWIATCAGAKSNYQPNQGRMLCGYWPPISANPGPSDTSGASSKDINISSWECLFSYVMRIRKRP